MYYLKNLRIARKERDLTQKQVCEILNMKQSQYSRYESGEDEMKVGTLIEICKALNTSADYILGLSDIQRPITVNQTGKNNFTNNGTFTNNGNINMN